MSALQTIISPSSGKERTEGCARAPSFLLTALLAVVFLRAIDGSYPSFFSRDTLFHAGTYSLIAPHWLWLVLGILAVTGTIHAVNLTDGLDGLATGYDRTSVGRVRFDFGAQTMVLPAAIF